jgi:hypothetical protein
MSEIRDDELDACEERVRQIQWIAGDLKITRRQLDRLSIEWYGQEPYKLPLKELDAFLRLLQTWQEVQA